MCVVGRSPDPGKPVLQHHVVHGEAQGPVAPPDVSPASDAPVDPMCADTLRALLRLDANQGWSAKQAVYALQVTGTDVRSLIAQFAHEQAHDPLHLPAKHR